MSDNDYPFSSDSEISSYHGSTSRYDCEKRFEQIYNFEEEEFLNFLFQKNGALAPIIIETKDDCLINETLKIEVKILKIHGS